MDAQPSRTKRCLTLCLPLILLTLTGCETARDLSLTHQLWDQAGPDYRNRPYTNSQPTFFQDAHRSDMLITMAFTIHVNGEAIEPFRLPAYPARQMPVKKTLLTPFAVAGDTVMCSLGAALFGFVLWTKVGYPGT